MLFFLRAFAYANVGHLEVNFRLHKNVNVFSWRVHMIGCGSTVLYATGQNPYSLPVVFWVQFLLRADTQWPTPLQQEVCDAVDIIVTILQKCFCFRFVNVIFMFFECFFKQSLSVNRRFDYRENLILKCRIWCLFRLNFKVDSSCSTSFSSSHSLFDVILMLDFTLCVISNILQYYIHLHCLHSNSSALF